MKHKILSTIENNSLIFSGSRVLVALSGGSDSMCLLNVLSELKDELKISLCAAHVNHNLRGNDSIKDERFVVDYCEKNNIELHLLSVDVNSLAKEKGVSVEEAGREVRYDFFNSIENIDIITTAHNLNDRIETFIFNFTRGTTLKGLSSIPIKRDKIVRPLMDCSKDEVLNYCSKNNIPFVVDKTNEENDYSRNKIRNTVITQLKTINSDFEKAALRCLNSISEDNDYLDQQAIENYNISKSNDRFCIETLSNLHPSVRKRVIALIIRLNTDSDVNYHLVTQIDNLVNNYAKTKLGSRYQISGSLFIRARAGYLEFTNDEIKSISSMQLQLGDNICGEYNISLKLCKNSSCLQSIDRDCYTYCCDFEKIQGNLFVRGRLPSDKLKLPKRNVTKDLRKIQNELNIPPEERDSLPVIYDENGIVLAHKCGLDARINIDNNTEKVLKISIMKVIV